MYGKTPVPIADDIVRKVAGSTEAVPCDENFELNKVKAEMAIYYEKDEDILSYAMFGNVATEFFKTRQAKKNKLDENLLSENRKVYPI
jgi:oxaloacetate decarboxylase alpha subunit